MSWWVMEQVSVNEAGTQTLANIQCDNVSDLPASDQSATFGYIIVRGSQAKVLATSENYILGSTGTWVKMEDGVKLDLTGYATEQYVDDGLADKVDASVYSSGQAAQDAVIDELVETKASLNDIYGIKNQLPNGTDLNNLSAGIMMCPGATVAATLINCPTTDAFIIYTDYLAAVSRAIQRIYSFSTTTGIPAQYMRARWSQGWTPWYQVMMQSV